MITFEQALEKANELLDRPAKACDEFKQAYRFNDCSDSYGGFTDVVILKETGEALTFIQFITRYHPEKRPKRIPLNKKEGKYLHVVRGV